MTTDPGGGCAPSTPKCPQDADILETHDAIDHIEREIRERFGVEATVHMDPIATDDEQINRLRAQVAELAQAVEPGMTIHDFRVVRGPTHTNVIFDAVVPAASRADDQQLRDRLARAVRTPGSGVQPVIQLDAAYTGG